MLLKHVNRKNKNLEKLLIKNKTSPLLKTPEKDFRNTGETGDIQVTEVSESHIFRCHLKPGLSDDFGPLEYPF